MSEPSMAHLPGSSVICVGIATLDYIYGVETLPTEGKKYRASALEVQGGGIAANAAVAIARLGGAASLLTRLGDDLTGDAVRTGLAREGVDVAASLAEAGRRTPVSAIMVDKAGERMIMSYSDPDMPTEPPWLPQLLPPGTGAVLGDTRWEEGALHLFQLARGAGIPVEVVDTLGAGDVWHGAFALALAEQQPEIPAVRFANAAAAIKCTRFGGRKGAPTRAEVEQFLQERT